jgi:hypothetical protein
VLSSKHIQNRRLRECATGIYCFRFYFQITSRDKFFSLAQRRSRALEDGSDSDLTFTLFTSEAEIATFEVLTELLLTVQFFCDVTLYR